jgi:hypothetical protein
MLLHIDGEIVEIRPGELFDSKGLVESRYLELLDQSKKPKRGPKPKVQAVKEDGSDYSRS